MYRITVESSFSAAHHLANYRGNCEKVHGHNWKIRVSAVFKELKESGFAMDFRELKGVLREVLVKLDYKDLNELDYFIDSNPTSENIAKYVYDEIKGSGVPVDEVTVFETDTCSATYYETQSR